MDPIRKTMTSLFEAQPYMLVDALQWSKEIEQGEFDELYPRSVTPEGMEADEGKFPLLINAAFVDAEVLARWIDRVADSLQTGQPHPFSAVLEVDRDEMTFEMLRTHLAQQLIQRDRATNQKFLLRYFDPRVFAHLPTTLTPGQMRSLLGPVLRWHYPHLNTWQTQHVPAVSPDRLMVIDTPQWNYLHRIGEINRVVAQLDDAAEWRFAELAQQIYESLRRAESQYRLVHADDRVAFALHAMTVHRNFDGHPILVELFARLTSDPEASYADLANAITPDEWDAVRQWRVMASHA